MTEAAGGCEQGPFKSLDQFVDFSLKSGRKLSALIAQEPLFILVTT